ncbi:hypothetical protein MF672_050660 (plasmid) [Actinomadura sp. ATCC 31491]|uniref:Uncharacterized protein n=1 Tax=Actinomadura luzonensis TaxID=2805427 RepID=A0ABT0GC73_9ACTN|nr:hypothetical protein [Actinomadura luzonensis]MCK2222018.1 hypothetical protein [Actinomadura luzonensis]
MVAGAVVAAGLCLALAWASGRGHRWARAAFVLLTAVNCADLLRGLAAGSAGYARADVTAAAGLCLVQVAAVVLLLRPAARREAPG